MAALPDEHAPRTATQTAAGGETAASAAPPAPHIGRYRVLARLGQGAMGTVDKALDPALDRVVAIKTIMPALLALPGNEATFVERFRREGRAAARLSHPNIVAVHDTGADERSGAPFIVMEYVDGVSLATVLHENPLLPPAQALDLSCQVAAALDEAHRHGVVHRDIKPANVLLDARGVAKVADFGIARLPDSELTATGAAPGTPGYLAPEVLRGAPADARSDVFALGALAYVLFTGQRPFRGDTQAALGLSVVQDAPAEPHALRPELPPAVGAAILRALAKDPLARTPDARSFAQELRAAFAGGESAGHAPVVARPRAGRLRLAVLGLGAALFAALLIAAAWLAWPAPDAPAAVTNEPSAGAAPARPATSTPRRAPSPREIDTPAEAARPPGWSKGRGNGKGAGQGKKKSRDK